jgi:hypothetical protein
LGFSAPEAQHRNAEMLCRPPDFWGKARQSAQQNAAKRSEPAEETWKLLLLFDEICSGLLQATSGDFR